MQTHLIIHSNQAKFSDLNLCPASSVLFVVSRTINPPTLKTSLRFSSLSLQITPFITLPKE